jgi:hypothetical protein
VKTITAIGIMYGLMLGLTASAADTPGEPRVLFAAERQARVAEASAKLALTLARFEKSIAGPNPTPSIRDLPNAALAVLYLGKDPREAERMVDMAFAQQDMDPKSPSYGSVPWQIGHPDIHDENAIDFVNQAIGPMLIHYGDKLSPEFKAELLPHMRASFAAMLRRKLAVSYTNIWLMRTVNMILMGEAINDASAADEGYRQLDQWIDYTRHAGVHEFDSPTYYFVDLDSLSAGYLYAKRANGREKLKAVLDYFWIDIAANYFVPNGVLSGPHSRNYSFTSSAGGLDMYLYTEGFRSTDDIGRSDFEKIFLLETAGEQGYHVGDPIISIARQPERIVQSRWDVSPDHDRYNYITSGFAIGSASGDYGAQDKLVSVELASGDKLPVIAIIPDIFDAPYGVVKTLDKSGHSKPTHPKYNPMCVQDHGMALATIDIDASKLPDVETLATDILLPADPTHLTAEGTFVDASKPFEKVLSDHTVIALRDGDAGVAIRILHVDGCAGAAPQVMLKADADGLKLHAARYVAYAYRGPKAHLSDKHVRFAAMIVARPCPSDADLLRLIRDVSSADVIDRQTEKAWDVQATLAGTQLAIVRDLKSSKAVSRQVNGHDVNSAALALNGTDLAGPLWAPFAAEIEAKQPPSASK